MSAAELSRLLFLTSGITADKYGNARRTAPSSGALYPIEVYAVVHNVDGVERGVYHYAYREHALEQVRAGDFRRTWSSRRSPRSSSASAAWSCS